MDVGPVDAQLAAARVALERDLLEHDDDGQRRNLKELIEQEFDARQIKLGPEDLDKLYPGPELVQMTQHSIASTAALKTELAAVRRRGHATSNEEGEEGVISIAVPLRSQTFALNASVPVSRMTRDLRTTVLSKLHAAATEIEALLP